MDPRPLLHPRSHSLSVEVGIEQDEDGDVTIFGDLGGWGTIEETTDADGYVTSVTLELDLHDGSMGRDPDTGEAYTEPLVVSGHTLGSCLAKLVAIAADAVAADLEASHAAFACWEERKLRGATKCDATPGATT